MADKKIYEGVKKIQLKRKYRGDEYPAITVGKNAKVRNPVLSFIEKNNPNQAQLNNFMEKNGISKVWMNKNVSYFEENGDFIGLTSKGKKVLKGVNESDDDKKELKKVNKILDILKSNDISFEVTGEGGHLTIDIPNFKDIDKPLKNKLSSLMKESCVEYTATTFVFEADDEEDTTPKGGDAEFDVEDLDDNEIKNILSYLEDNDINFEYEYEDGEFSLDIEDYDDLDSDIKDELESKLSNADLLEVLDENDEDYDEYEEIDEAYNEDGELITEKLVKKWKVKNGKKVKVRKTDKEGYKTVTKDGKSKEVKMSAEEKRTRKKAAKKMKKTKKKTFKGAAKAKSDRKRKKNAKIRKRLIRDDVNESFQSFTEFVTESQNINEARENVEYVIWGVPKGERDEVVVFTKAESKKEADKVMKILADKHGVSKLRLQILDLSTAIDWSKTIKESQNINEVSREVIDGVVYVSGITPKNIDADEDMQTIFNNFKGGEQSYTIDSENDILIYHNGTMTHVIKFNNKSAVKAVNNIFYKKGLTNYQG